MPDSPDSKDQRPMAPSEPPEALTPLQVQHILAPTDLSPHSDEALRYAIRLALALNAKLVLLHVAEVYVDPPSGDHALRMVDPYEIQGWRGQLKREFDAYLARFGPLPPNCERWLRSATDPWRQMLAAAAEMSADLLVIATHGRAGLAHLFHPNHADRILHEAPCPVLVVRSPHAPAPAKPA
jgi:universal stress protein A